MSITIYAPPTVPADEDDRTAAVIASGMLDTLNDARLVALVERARREFDTACAAVTLLHGDRQTVVAGAGCLPGSYRRSTSFCGHAILERTGLLYVPDAALDDRFAGNPYVIDDRIVRFYAAAVIRGTSGHALGALCIFDPAPRQTFSTAEAAHLVELAESVLPAHPRRSAAGRQVRVHATAAVHG